MQTHHYSLRRDAIILIIYLLLSIVFTLPLVGHWDTHSVGKEVDSPPLTWSLWWVRYALLNLGTSPFETNYVFYPVGINLVAYTATFLNGIVSIPLQLLFSVIVAQNCMILFALVVGGYGTCLLAREILARCHLESELAAILAGAFYAFGAWHLNYVAAGHFNLLHNEWIPFSVLYLIRMDQASWKNGARAGLFFGLTVWTELTLGTFVGIFAALYWLTQIISRRTALFTKYFAQNFIAFTLVSGLSLAPLVLNLWQDVQRYGYYLTSNVGRFYIFSAEPISFFVPSARHPLLGTWAQSVTNANTNYAFIGYAVMILALLGVTFQRGARLWAGLAAMFALLMFGPTLIINETDTHIPMPFALLNALPFVNANRYPVRLNVMLMLSLTPLLALGSARLLNTAQGKFALGTLTMLLVFEQLVIPIPLVDLRAPKIFETIRAESGDFAILHLPLGWRGSVMLEGKPDEKVQFYQTVHHKRLLEGISSRFPRFKLQYFREAPVINSLIALTNGRAVDDVRIELDRQAAPTVLHFFDIRYVEVNHTLADPNLLAYVHNVFPLTEIYRDETRVVYRVTRSIPPPIDLNAETARLYFDDRWGRVQYHPDGTAYRWATRAESLMWLPLEPRDQTLILRLRGVYTQQPLTVRVNRHTIATLRLSTEWEEYAIPLARNILHDGLTEIVFTTTTQPVSATRQDDYHIGDTGVISPVDICAIGAGYDAGRFGEIWVAGKNVIESKRGYHLVALNPHNGAVKQVGSFDTFTDANESARLAEFITALSNGEIVVGVAIDDVSKNLQASAVEALRSIGVENDLRFQFRMGHAFIGVKGAAIGHALEHVDGRLPTNVYVGKNVPSREVAFALGGLILR